MLRLAFDFIITWRETRTRPNAYDIHEELPIAKATVSQHLKELKEAGLIQGEIETPKVKYCINKENWETAKKMFADFLGQPICKKEGCCK